jgi:hypothetical protein
MEGLITRRLDSVADLPPGPLGLADLEERATQSAWSIVAIGEHAGRRYRGGLRRGDCSTGPAGLEGNWPGCHPLFADPRQRPADAAGGAAGYDPARMAGQLRVRTAAARRRSAPASSPVHPADHRYPGGLCQRRAAAWRASQLTRSGRYPILFQNGRDSGLVTA